MISSVTNPDLFTNGTANAARSPKKALDKDAFLQLLVTQLKYQDPSNTMDVFQMSSQLAQFAGVEQLTLLNTAMTTQSEATQLNMLVGQTSFSASLLGKEILANGDQVHVPSSGTTSVHVDVGGTGGVATLKLYDSTGNVVSTKELGRLGPGAQDVTLPRGLPDGDWRYSIEVRGADGKSVPVTTFTSGTVTGVQFLNGQIRLQLGGINISLDDLVSIGRGSSGSGSSGGTVTPPATNPDTGPSLPDPGTPDDHRR